MQGDSSLRELVGTTVTLVQGELRVDGVVTEVCVCLGDPDSEEAQVRVDTANGDLYIVHLTPGDWSRALRVFPLHDLLPDQPVTVEWQRAATPLDAAPRRGRPSTLAE